MCCTKHSITYYLFIVFIEGINSKILISKILILISIPVYTERKNILQKVLPNTKRLFTRWVPITYLLAVKLEIS